MQSGFLDATELQPGKYIAHVTLYYGDTITKKKGTIKVVEPGAEFEFPMFAIGIILAIVGGIGLFFLFLIIMLFILKNSLKIEVSNSKGSLKNGKKK